MARFERERRTRKCADGHGMDVSRVGFGEMRERSAPTLAKYIVSRYIRPPRQNIMLADLLATLGLAPSDLDACETPAAEFMPALSSA